MLCDRRDELSRARNQGLNRLHRLFLDLLPGGAPVKRHRGVVEEPPVFPATRRTVASAIRARREPRTACPAMTL